MCDKKPGLRCADDTRHSAVSTVDAYTSAHPDGPQVNPMDAAQVTFGTDNRADDSFADFADAHSNSTASLPTETTPTATPTYTRHTSHITTTVATDDDECLHGMNPQWCADCKGMGARTLYSTPTGRTHNDGPTKQELLDKMCNVLEHPRVQIGEGSSLPSKVFKAAARRAEVPDGSMPEIAERITVKAGLKWGADCDSRETSSAGGSTVTREGLEVMTHALELLAAQKQCVECGTTVTKDEQIDGMCFPCVDAATQ